MKSGKIKNFFKQHWKSLLSCFFIGILAIYVPVFAMKKARDFEVYKEPKIETKIYTVWHVETFEGGGKSRITYLKNIAKEIEKQHAGVLFMVQNIDPEKLESEIACQKPDIISFGYGVGGTVLNSLFELDKTFDVRDELVESGSFAGKVYALPYIMSGYAIISHSEDFSNLQCGKSEYIKPTEISNTLKLTPKESENSYEAYKKFVNDKTSSLLGTARDVFRVNNLNNIGRTSATISPMGYYTDLVQYIGVTKKDEIINKFLEYVFDNSHQQKLSEYSLFSSKHNKIYSSGIYNDMENAILRCEVAKVFDER